MPGATTRGPVAGMTSPRGYCHVGGHVRRGNNLFTFLAARLSGSYDNLDCAQYGLANPVHLITDENGATTGATFGGTVPATPSRAPSGTGTATASPTAPGSPAPTSAPPASTSPASAPPSESATPTGAAAQ